MGENDMKIEEKDTVLKEENRRCLSCCFYFSCMKFLFACFSFIFSLHFFLPFIHYRFSISFLSFPFHSLYHFLSLFPVFLPFLSLPFLSPFIFITFFHSYLPFLSFLIQCIPFFTILPFFLYFFFLFSSPFLSFHLRSFRSLHISFIFSAVPFLPFLFLFCTSHPFSFLPIFCLFPLSFVFSLSCRLPPLQVQTTGTYYRRKLQVQTRLIHQPYEGEKMEQKYMRPDHSPSRSRLSLLLFSLFLSLSLIFFPQ